ncbi:MAG TPA: ABC transporter permease, partial [Steroidobacteraceae bacterium]|nr:ABC transporter permease [Steroidobacteraceae bacterium]
MKYLPLVWSGIWRKPGRTVLIFLQVAVAFALFGVLQGLKTGVQHAVDEARADLLIVHSRESLIMEGLPISILEPIRAVPGVRVAIPVELFGCQYQKPEQGLLSVAVAPDKDWTTAFTFAIAPRDLAAFEKSRTAALVLETTAKKYGWKIGDRIPLICRTVQKTGSPNWTFEVVGTFTDSDFGGGGDKILMNFAYYDEARATGGGKVNHFNVSVTDPNQAVPVADAIDR